MEFTSTVSTAPRPATNDGESGDDWAKAAVLAPLPPLSVPASVDAGAECSIDVSARGLSQNNFGVPAAATIPVIVQGILGDAIQGRSLGSNPAGRGRPFTSNGDTL